MKTIYSLFSLWVLFCFILNPFLLQAQNSPSNIYFILDGSGSMWQKVDGAFKIETARKVLKNLARKLPSETKVGLVAYGHREKGNCDDIETLIPFGKINAASFSEVVDGINPVGKTPITASIKETIELIKTNGEQSTIILISDGLETCSGDPCETVALAKQEGLPFVLHVVGFGLEEDDVSSLECTAQAGGGLYFDVKNANDLTQALDQAIETPSEELGAYLSVKAVANGKLTDVSIRAYKANDSKYPITSRTYRSAKTNPRILALAPGLYQVKVKALEFDGEVEISLDQLKLVEGDTLVKELDFSSGTISVGVTKNGELADATVSVYQHGTSKEVDKSRTYNTSKTNPKSFELTPGVYDIAVKLLQVTGVTVEKIDSVVVVPQETESLNKAFVSGTVEIQTLAGNTPTDAVARIYAPDTNKQVGIKRTYGKKVSLEMVPGKYIIKTKPIDKSLGKIKEQTIEIKAKETTSVSVVF